MDESESSFCMACGTRLPADAEYCPGCGATVGTATPSARPASRPASAPSVTLPVILTGLYAIIAVLSGIGTMSGAEAIVGAFKEAIISSGYDWASTLASLGFSSDSQLVSCLFNNGVVTLVSGALVAVSCGLIMLARYHLVAVASCVAGSVALIATVALVPSELLSSVLIAALFETLIGCLVAYFIYRAKDAFQD